MRIYCSCILKEISHLSPSTPRACIQIFVTFAQTCGLVQSRAGCSAELTIHYFSSNLKKMMSIFVMASSHVLVNMTLNCVFGTQELPPVFSIS